MTYTIIIFGSGLMGVMAFLSLMVIIDGKNEARQLSRVGRYAILPSAMLSIAGAAIIVGYGYAASPAVVGVRLDGVGYSMFTEPVICWQRNCILFATNSQVEGAVQPITDNPKVRHLKYKFEVEIVDPIAFARAVQLQPGAMCPGEGPMKCQLNDAVLYEIYEFNNANSKELARFYNPYDKNQTGELQKLMNIRLTPPLAAKGINFKRLVSWSVE